VIVAVGVNEDAEVLGMGIVLSEAETSGPRSFASFPAAAAEASNS
jgi:hypothetical protein